MDQQILNATITIEEVADKEKKPSLKTNDGNRSFTYSIWKTKQDGSPTSAYSQFKNMGLAVGSTVMVGYVIDEYDAEINGMSKRIQSNKIINFRESNGLQTPPRQDSSNGGANRASQGHSSDAFGRRLGVQGHINALLGNTSIFSGGKMKVISELTVSEIVTLAIQIENEAEKQLSAASLERANLNQDLPVIQVDEDREALDQIAQDTPF